MEASLKRKDNALQWFGNFLFSGGVEVSKGQRNWSFEEEIFKRQSDF